MQNTFNKARTLPIPKQQKGSVLIVSLIMLVLLTMVGVASVSDMTLNERMASNFRDHDYAFQLAEGALKEGEAWVEDFDTSFSQDFVLAACEGNNCFDSVCTNGQCFNGTFPEQTTSSGGGGGGGGGRGGGGGGGSSSTTSSGSPGVCNVVSPETPVWLVESYWETAKTYSVLVPGVQAQPKYLIEFMCYVAADPDSGTPTAPPPYNADWARIYRITALASGSTPESQVMLQSTYKVLQN